jgi:hypothetical protein
MLNIVYYMKLMLKVCEVAKLYRCTIYALHLTQLTRIPNAYVQMVLPCRHHVLSSPYQLGLISYQLGLARTMLTAIICYMLSEVDAVQHLRYSRHHVCR